MTDVRSNLPAAGWYSDPIDPAARRWWDGTAWTTHVAVPPASPPAAPARPPEPAWDPGFVTPTPRSSGLAMPQPYRPFADRDARDPFVAEGLQQGWRRDPSPNPAATRAAIAAALVAVFVGASVALKIPVGVPFVAIGVAIVFGILGIARSRETLSGLRRSIAAVVVGGVALVVTLLTIGSAVAGASVDYTTEYEASLVDLFNSVTPVTAAASADCAQIEVPHDGDTIPCTVFLVDGRQLAVVLTITSDRGAYIADIPR